MKVIAVVFATLISSTFCLDMAAWAGRRTSSSSSSGEVSVRGYYKSNGTYVAPYTRTSPNGTKNDNWSTVGNTNPYTGRQGTQQGDYTNPTTYPYPSSDSLYEPVQRTYEPVQPQKKCALKTSTGRTISSAWFCGD
jgi:hypothetical protein